MRSVWMVIAAACLVTGCQKKTEPVMPPLEASTVSGEALWKRITRETDYDTYAFWPGHEGLRPGQSPHGKYHEIYINRTLRSALPIAGKQAPEGSIVVKENFSADKKEQSVTVMAKVRGFDPAHDDWFWAMYDPTGKILAQGKLTDCSGCHEGMRANDYLIVRALDAPVPETR